MVWIASDTVTPSLRRIALFAGLALVLGLWLVARLQVTTDISAFLPTGAEREQAQISRAVVESELSRMWMVALEASDQDQAIAASVGFEAALRADATVMDEVEAIVGGPPKHLDEAMWQLYQPRRLAFLAPSPTEVAERVTEEGLKQAAIALRDKLASPMSTLVAKVAPADPFLILPSLFDTVGRNTGRRFQPIEGRFIADDRFAIVLLTTRASAFDGQAQARIDEAIQRAAGALPGPVTLHVSALGRFSIAAERTIRADIQRTSVVSVVGLLGLALVLFRSLRLAWLSMIPIAMGTLLAIAVTMAVFGSVHGLTLAFGASLIGVCIDYVVHFYVHWSTASTEVSPREIMRTIWPGVGLGAATTMMGFVVIAGSSFPGLQQVSLFAVVGVLGALITTRSLLPWLVPDVARSVGARTWLLERMQRLDAGLWRWRRGLVVMPIIGVVATVIGVVQIRWDDGWEQARHLDPAMMQDDTLVRDLVAPFDQSRFIMAIGPDDAAALEVNDRVADRLRAWKGLDGWQGVSPWLPSPARQRAIAAVMRDDPGFVDRFRSVFREQGFAVAGFEPFVAALADAEPEPLGFDDLARSPLRSGLGAFRVPLPIVGSPDRVGFVTVLRGVNDPVALQAAIETIPGARWIDQAALIRHAHRRYRQRTVLLLVIGLVAVFGVLWLRYRRWAPSLAALLPAVLAAGTTVFVLAMLGIPLNLVGLTALLMVLSMGVDYGVFLVETIRVDRSLVGATMLALVVAWASTVFGFGLLALSQHPIMRSIGIVAGVGVTASLLLAPAAMVLLPAHKGHDAT